MNTVNTAKKADLSGHFVKVAVLRSCIFMQVALSNTIQLFKLIFYYSQ